ncbi:hypothetical protein ACYOEI_22865, partial [Singulisphaera rosea]
IAATGTASDTFVVRTVSDATVALTLGTAVSGSITGTGQQRNYTFTLASPTTLWFDSQTNDGNLNWSIKGAQGTVYGTTYFNYDDRNVGLLPAGTYTLTVSGYGDYLGSYKFNLLDFGAATAIIVGSSGTPAGQTVSATLSPANSTKLYKFTGTAGDSFLFHNISVTGDYAYWQLYDPFNRQLFSNGAASDASGVVLPTNGTYTLVLSGAVGDSTSPNYSFQVNYQSHTTPTSIGGTSLTLGSPISGTVSAGGIDFYQFTLANPTRLWFDTQTYDSSLSWTLSGLQGPVIGYENFVWDDQVIGLLPAGTYSLQVSGPAGEAYSFNVLDFASATPISTGSSVTATLTPSNSPAFYSFSGTAGSVIYLNNTAFSTSDPNGYRGNWYLYDSFGTQVFASDLINDSGRVTLPTTGTYTLVVSGVVYSSGTASDTFVVSPVTDTTTPLTLATSVTGSISSPGQRSNYTFTLASPDRLWFDSQTNDNTFVWFLTGPQGVVYSDTGFGSGERSIGLLLSGTYTLTVYAQGEQTGSFGFSLLSFSGASAVTPGTTVSDSLNPGDSSKAYKFSGTAGSSIFIDNPNSSSYDPYGYTQGYFTLIDALGTTVFNGYLDNDSGRITLPTTGTYTLIADGWLGATTPVSYSFIVKPITDNIKQLWGTSGDDSILVQYLDANTRDVYLNGYLEGTLSGTATLTIMGMGGNDSLTVVGTGSADTFTISPTQVALGSSANVLVGIANVTVDGSGGADTFNYSGSNPKLTLLGGAGLDTFAPADNASILRLDGGADGAILNESASTT